MCEEVPGVIRLEDAKAGEGAEVGATIGAMDFGLLGVVIVLLT